MKVSLKALGWAIRFFWIITLAFAITCVYSVTLIQASFGEPNMILNESELNIELPITFNNGGYYSLTNFNLTSLIIDDQQSQIGRATSFFTKIGPKENMTFHHDINLNITETLKYTYHLFNDSSLTLNGLGQLVYAGMIPFSFEANITIPWGAPLNNFTIHDPSFSLHNATHVRLNVPISFQNHSPYFGVLGSMHIEIANNRDQLVGTDTISLDVPSTANYVGQIELLIDTILVTSNGEIRVSFETNSFNYGPLVMSYG